eukprot:157536-Pelagomonas_calceolata.AAC.9
MLGLRRRVATQGSSNRPATGDFIKTLACASGRVNPVRSNLKFSWTRSGGTQKIIEASLVKFEKSMSGRHQLNSTMQRDVGEGGPESPSIIV